MQVINGNAPIPALRAHIRLTYQRQAFAVALVATAILSGMCAGIVWPERSTFATVMLVLDVLQIAASGYIFMVAADLRRELNALIILKQLNGNGKNGNGHTPAK